VRVTLLKIQPEKRTKKKKKKRKKKKLRDDEFDDEYSLCSSILPFFTRKNLNKEKKENIKTL